MPTITATAGDTAALMPLDLYSARRNVIDITVLNPDGTPYSFTGYSARADVKPYAGAASALSLSTGSGSLVLTSGNLRILTTTAAMTGVPAQNGYISVVLVDGSGEATEFARGPVMILPVWS
jgi:hypothetical protein